MMTDVVIIRLLFNINKIILGICDTHFSSDGYSGENFNERLQNSSGEIMPVSCDPKYNFESFVFSSKRSFSNLRGMLHQVVLNLSKL